MYRIWLDTETTGLPALGDIQITEIAYVIQNISTGEVMERVYDKVALRKDSFLSPYALHINRSDILTNPTDRISEYDVAKKLEAVCAKYTVKDGNRDIYPIFTAYNGKSFDKPLVDKLLRRAGVKPNKVFNKNVCDPIKYAENLRTQKKLKTKLTAVKKMHSTSLVAVAELYGVNSNGAHNAMADVDMMMQVSDKLFKDLTGKNMSECIDPMPSVYEVGKIYNITSSSSSGVKNRDILVLENNLNGGKLQVLDSLSVIEANDSFKDNVLREFNYDTIIEDKMTSEDVHGLNDYYEKFKDKIDPEIANRIIAAKSKENAAAENEKFSEEFDITVDAAESLLASGSSYSMVKKSLIEDGGHDEMQAEFIINFANKKCLIKGVDTAIDSNHYARLSENQLSLMNKEFSKLETEYDPTNPANASICIIYQNLRDQYPDVISKCNVLDATIASTPAHKIRYCRVCGKTLSVGDSDVGPDCMAKLAMKKVS